MSAIAAVLSTPAGSALLAAGVSQVVNVLSGADPAAEAASFAQACAAYQAAAAAWQAAETANPATDAPKPAA